MLGILEIRHLYRKNLQFEHITTHCGGLCISIVQKTVGKVV